MPLQAELAQHADSSLQAKGNAQIRSTLTVKNFREQVTAGLQQKSYSQILVFTDYLEDSSAPELSHARQLLIPFLAATREAGKKREREAGPALEALSREFLAALRQGASAVACESFNKRLVEVWDFRWYPQSNSAPIDPLTEKARALGQLISAWQQCVRAESANRRPPPFVHVFTSHVELAGLGRTELLGELEKAAQRLPSTAESHDEHWRERTVALLQRVRQGVDYALKSAELDPVIAEANALQADMAQAPDRPQARLLGPQVGSALGLLTRWREYLVAGEQGDWRMARDIMQGLMDSSGDFVAFYPRSRLLRPEVIRRARMAEWSKATGHFKIPEHLADLPAAARAVTTAASYGYEFPRIREGVGNLGIAQTHLQGGDPLTFLWYFRSRIVLNEPGARLALEELHQRLAAPVLALFMGLTRVFPASQDEMAFHYLRRVEDYALQRHDRRVLFNALEAMRWMQERDTYPPQWVLHETNALRHFLNGTVTEQFGEYTTAYIEYRLALEYPSQFLPCVELSRRITRLVQTHSPDLRAAAFSLERSYLDPNEPEQFPLSPRYNSAPQGSSVYEISNKQSTPVLWHSEIPGDPGDFPLPPWLVTPAKPY